MMIMLVLLSACSTVKPHYMEARRIDTVAAYQEFLRNHPESEFTTAAKTRIEEIKFEKAKSLNTVSAYEQFIDASHSELFKNYAHQLMQKIYETEYEKTKEIDSLEAYQAYFDKYPKSIFLTDCTMRIESLTWIKTIKENTAFSYYTYLNDCEACGRHDQEARTRLKNKIKNGVEVSLPSVKDMVEKILNRSDIVVIQKSSNSISTRTGSVSLENLMKAEEVLVSIAKEIQGISAADLAQGNFESVKKLRLKHRVAGENSNTVGFSTIMIYPEKNGPTDVIFIADGKGYLFQETDMK